MARPAKLHFTPSNNRPGLIKAPPVGPKQLVVARGDPPPVLANLFFDPALRPYARRLYALTLALSAIRVCWLPEGVAAAPAADAVLDQVPGDAAGWAAALTWHGRAWVLLSDAGYADAAANQAAAVETLGRRLANAETLNPEERQRLSRQMATLRQQIAHPLVDPS